MFLKRRVRPKREATETKQRRDEVWTMMRGVFGAEIGKSPPVLSQGRDDPLLYGSRSSIESMTVSEMKEEKHHKPKFQGAATQPNTRKKKGSNTKSPKAERRSKEKKEDDDDKHKDEKKTKQKRKSKEVKEPSSSSSTIIDDATKGDHKPDEDDKIEDSTQRFIHELSYLDEDDEDCLPQDRMSGGNLEHDVPQTGRNRALTRDILNLSTVLIFDVMNDLPPAGSSLDEDDFLNEIKPIQKPVDEVHSHEQQSNHHSTSPPSELHIQVSPRLRQSSPRLEFPVSPRLASSHNPVSPRLGPSSPRIGSHKIDSTPPKHPPPQPPSLNNADSSNNMSELEQQQAKTIEEQQKELHRLRAQIESFERDRLRGTQDSLPPTPASSIISTSTTSSTPHVPTIFATSGRQKSTEKTKTMCSIMSYYTLVEAASQALVVHQILLLSEKLYAKASGRMTIEEMEAAGESGRWKVKVKIATPIFAGDVRKNSQVGQCVFWIFNVAPPIDIKQVEKRQRMMDRGELNELHNSLLQRLEAEKELILNSPRGVQVN
eukprot:TRINITY_DN5630_c0_g1_i1.p1 TRINITY_DN5630_c0_g1~~TRINITY_DN5630_c0_g1_i1.p1  ORF type:complete len:544 (-),score=129.56 TRINITY_DN5630_c0_g1_i1:272-1903(-)